MVRRPSKSTRRLSSSSNSRDVSVREESGEAPQVEPGIAARAVIRRDERTRPSKEAVVAPGIITGEEIANLARRTEEAGSASMRGDMDCLPLADQPCRRLYADEAVRRSAHPRFRRKPRAPGGDRPLLKAGGFEVGTGAIICVGRHRRSCDDRAAARARSAVCRTRTGRCASPRSIAARDQNGSWRIGTPIRSCTASTWSRRPRSPAADPLRPRSRGDDRSRSNTAQGASARAT